MIKEIRTLSPPKRHTEVLVTLSCCALDAALQITYVAW